MTRLFAFCSLISGLFALAIVTGATAQGEQYGCKRTNFEVGRAKAFLIHPPKLPDGGSRPWVWYAPTIGGHPNASNEWVLKRLLEKGFTVAGVNVGESYGSPAGRKVFTDFYDHVVKEHRLDARANLHAQSRGGLMHYNWAVENPEKVRAIVGIYPVCDLRSYPGLKSAAGAYGLTPAELEKQLARHNPIDRLEPLARAKVPVLHVHGDSDKVVSLEANSKALVDRYAALGGPVRLIVVPGKGHAEIAEFFQEPRVVQFFLDAKLPETKERWKRLTVDEATKLLERPNSLRLDVTELSADVAAVLARYKGELRFESLSSLTPDAAAALAKREGQIDLPKLNALSSATAKALAVAKGALHLPGMKELSVEVVEALAPHTGVLELGVTELSEAQAVALAKHVGQLNLRGLKSLTSLPLAERLGQQEWLFLDSVTQLTPEIARAICPPANREKFKDHVQLYIGLTELPADVAAAIMAGRGHISAGSLVSISEEAAAAWSGPFANIRLFGLKKLSPAAAASLTKGRGIFDIRVFGPEVSDETAAAIVKQMSAGPHREIDFNGLKKLTSPPLAVALLSRGDGPHSQLNGVAEITDAVARALAESRGKINGLPGLTSLTSVPLAAKYAAQPGNLRFPKLTTISDDVAKAFATHKGKLDLSGLKVLSEEAAKALAKQEGEVVLTGLTVVPESGTALLRANEKIKLPPKLQKP